MDAATLTLSGYLVAMMVAAAASIRSSEAALGGIVVIYLWSVGEVAALNDWRPPAPLYIVTDAAAFAFFWFICRSPGCRAFASTYAVQIGLHLAFIAGLFEPLTYWWIHAASAYAQLVVLVGWAIASRKEVAV